jgi:UDP-GlcNAc3NAcA epimerase
MKVFSVVGNRPQFVKAAPTSVALRERGIDEIVLHTGQHYDRELSQVFFEELGLEEPGYALDLRTADAAEMQAAIAGPLREQEPDWVLVYGDTNSTLAGALAAAEAGVPLAHVEAGLRSGDLSMPEERNRIEVDRLARLLFTPDERSRDRLAAEGVPGQAEVVGDVMADATRLFEPIARKRVDPPVDGPYDVLTIHREANTDPERLRRLIVRLPGPSADAQGAGRARDRARAGDTAAPPGRLPRDARARRRSKGRRHGLGRPPEGGLLALRAVRHPAPFDGVGRHGAGRCEHARRPGRCRATRRGARPGVLPAGRAAALRRRQDSREDR